MKKWINIIVVLQLGILSSCTVGNAGAWDGFSYSTLGDIAAAEGAEAIVGQEQEVAIEPIAEGEASGQEAEETNAPEETVDVSAAENEESTLEDASDSEEEFVNVQGTIDLESANEYISTIITRTDSADTSDNAETTDITNPIQIPITDATNISTKTYAKTERKYNLPNETKTEHKLLVVFKIEYFNRKQTLESRLYYMYPERGVFSVPIPFKLFTLGGSLTTKLFVKKILASEEDAPRFFFVGDVKDVNKKEKIQFNSIEVLKPGKHLKIGDIKFERDVGPFSNQSYEYIDKLVSE